MGSETTAQMTSHVEVDKDLGETTVLGLFSEVLSLQPTPQESYLKRPRKCVLATPRDRESLLPVAK